MAAALRNEMKSKLETILKPLGIEINCLWKALGLLSRDRLAISVQVEGNQSAVEMRKIESRSVFPPHK